jgi:predicted TIM-barrel fold metal-dependent hydrolase
MPTKNHSAQAIRTRLSHPVIDSDGHWVEPVPLLRDYLAKVGGAKAIEGFRARNELVAGVLRLTPKERRERRLGQEAWWALPTRNTRDRATAMIPQLLYERLNELGLDFTVLYPTLGLMLPLVAEDEMRRAACRAFNMYIAEAFREFSDRIAPAAVIPMHTPCEAIEELEYAVRTLGFKVVMLGSLIPRPIPALVRAGVPVGAALWRDVLGLDSEYDYDPVWAKCVELGVAPTFHSNGRGFGLRRSPSNFTYNHIGHFAAAGEAVCKALFMGGVTRRFPTLKLAFLEGGAGWACALYADLIGHWKKRNRRALGEVNPAFLDRRLLYDLFTRYHGRAAADRLSEAKPAASGEKAMSEAWARDPAALDDFAACQIEKPEQIRDLFARNFYFGCEADDPINAWAFNSAVNPYGARLKVLFGSDIGHFDVPDMTEVLVEAHELVDDGIITAQDFRDFVFGYAVEFWAGMNPAFFKGTVVEEQARAWLAAHREPATTAATPHSG